MVEPALITNNDAFMDPGLCNNPKLTHSTIAPRAIRNNSRAGTRCEFAPSRRGGGGKCVLSASFSVHTCWWSVVSEEHLTVNIKKNRCVAEVLFSGVPRFACYMCISILRFLVKRNLFLLLFDLLVFLSHHHH